MANPNDPKTPAPEEKTATITLPPGMTEQAFLASFASFNKMRDYTAKRDKCVRTALNILKGKHEPEYIGYLSIELRKVNLPVK